MMQSSMSSSSVDKFVALASYSYPDKLDVDPEAKALFPNQESREVKSGHYVPVKPTPLPQPKLVIYSKDLAEELGLSEGLSEELIRFLGADQDALPGFDFSWATPYALAIYGSAMFQQCPFGNGRGYGDGRAISIAEVALDNGKRWELQLKGAGGTPFRRGGDGRAVLRSSIREFLASEAMHHMGVRTTRALSLVVSQEEAVARPWFSKQSTKGAPSIDDPRIAHYPLHTRRMIVEQLSMRLKEPDQMQMEPAAISCRVAPSFIRVGHLDLFARRARGIVPGVRGAERENDLKLGLEQLQKMVDFAIFREYPTAKSPLEFLELAGQRIAELTANWIRVGFCQGNFNSDNCLVSGRQMDYGPFGFIEKYNPLWNMWTGGGHHFAFMNQMEAGTKNFGTLVDSVMPMLSKDDKLTAEDLKNNHFAVAMDALNEVWGRKLGVVGEWSSEADQVVARLLELMEESEADWTLTFRTLSNMVESGKMDVEELSNIFYKPLSDEHAASWRDWIESWRKLHASGSASDIAKGMKLANPKYVPREWMLVAAYEGAYAGGDYSLIKELHELFRHPYDELPEFEEKYYRRAHASTYEGAGKPGTAFMT